MEAFMNVLLPRPPVINDYLDILSAFYHSERSRDCNADDGSRRGQAFHL
jgi:hypothetical protein